MKSKPFLDIEVKLLLAKYGRQEVVKCLAEISGVTVSEIEGELGDLLFVGINLARFLKVDPELAVKKANGKFSQRFREMESLAAERGTTLAAVSRPDLEALWEEAKSRRISS